MTAILDLPDWGEVRLWVATRPLTVQECAEAHRIVTDFIAAWQVESVSWLHDTPTISECEVFADQAFVFGYAALRSLSPQMEDPQPFYMYGSDIDPLLNSMDRFALRQLPRVEISPDDAIIVDGQMSPMSKAARLLGLQGRLSGATLVMTGGPIKRWRQLGAIHPLRDDCDLFAAFRDGFAKQGVELLDT